MVKANGVIAWVVGDAKVKDTDSMIETLKYGGLLCLKYTCWWYITEIVTSTFYKSTTPHTVRCNERVISG